MQLQLHSFYILLYSPRVFYNIVLEIIIIHPDNYAVLRYSYYVDSKMKYYFMSKTYLISYPFPIVHFTLFLVLQHCTHVWAILISTNLYL